MKYTAARIIMGAILALSAQHVGPAAQAAEAVRPAGLQTHRVTTSGKSVLYGRVGNGDWLIGDGLAVCRLAPKTLKAVPTGWTRYFDDEGEPSPINRWVQAHVTGTERSPYGGSVLLGVTRTGYAIYLQTITSVSAGKPHRLTGELWCQAPDGSPAKRIAERYQTESGYGMSPSGRWFTDQTHLIDGETGNSVSRGYYPVGDWAPDSSTYYYVTVSRANAYDLRAVVPGKSAPKVVWSSAPGAVQTQDGVNAVVLCDSSGGFCLYEDGRAGGQPQIKAMRFDPTGRGQDHPIANGNLVPLALASRPWLADVYRAALAGRAPLTYQDTADGRKVVGLDAKGGTVALLDQGVTEAAYDAASGRYIGLGKDGNIYVMWR